MRITHHITLGACLALCGAATGQEIERPTDGAFGVGERGGLVGTGVELLAWDTQDVGDDALVEVYTAPPGSFPITGDIPDVFVGQEIEFAEGVLYCADRFGFLHRLDPGSGSTLGQVPLTFPPEGDVITAMEYIEGIMYVCIGTMGAGGADTYFGTVDLGTGVVGVIGDTLVNAPITGLAYPGNGPFVYGVTGGGSSPRLYAIQASSVTTDIGPVTLGAAAAPSLTGLEFGADGRLYAIPNAVSPDVGNLYVVNPATGAALDLGPTGNTGLVAITSRQGCNDADLAPRFGQLDFDDVLRFLTTFGQGCPGL